MGKWGPLNDTLIAHSSSKRPTAHHSILPAWTLRKIFDRSLPQYLVILELLKTSPGLVGKIDAKLGLDTGTTTPLLKRMEQSGLISKRRDLQDERRVLVELTPAGHALHISVCTFCCRSAVAAGSASASRQAGQTPNVLASCTT